jgi:hypothetical protein
MEGILWVSITAAIFMGKVIKILKSKTCRQRSVARAQFVAGSSEVIFCEK